MPMETELLLLVDAIEGGILAFRGCLVKFVDPGVEAVAVPTAKPVGLALYSLLVARCVAVGGDTQY
jgi:hypothetical protein